MKLFTLRKRKTASAPDDCHLFEAKPGAGRGCICLPKSLCQKATTADTTALEEYMCLDRTGMQLRIADFGRAVCADCMADLYAGND